MNIFSILKIKETNVSHFLKYLLNPEEDHKLKDLVLKKICNDLYESVPEFKALIGRQFNGRKFNNLRLGKDIFYEVKSEQTYKKMKT